MVFSFRVETRRLPVRTPAVSIILPFRNAATTLPRALAGIRAQTLTQWQLLAIDDGSTDGSAAMVRRWARDDPRVTLLTPYPGDTAGGGVVRALERGMARAGAELIARMDADDEMHPERLAAQAGRLDREPGLDLVSCLVAHGGDAQRQSGYRRHIDRINRLTDHESMSLHRFVDAPVAHPSVMFRRRAVERWGGYRDGDFPEDFELWLRWLEGGARMAKVRRELLTWHDPPGRLSRTDPRYSPEAFARVRAPYLARWLGRHNPHHPGVMVWGAGRVSRRSMAPLLEQGIEVPAWIDVDPAKATRRGRDGRPVLLPDQLPTQDEGGSFVLANVGSTGAAERIAGWLTERGWQIGRDWLPTA